MNFLLSLSWSLRSQCFYEQTNSRVRAEKEADASPCLPATSHHTRRGQLSPRRTDHSFRAVVLKEWSTAQQREDHLGTGQPCKMPGPQPRGAKSVILISALECTSLEFENHCTGEQKPSSTACTDSGAVKARPGSRTSFQCGKESREDIIGNAWEPTPSAPLLEACGKDGLERQQEYWEFRAEREVGREQRVWQLFRLLAGWGLSSLPQLPRPLWQEPSPSPGSH